MLNTTSQPTHRETRFMPRLAINALVSFATALAIAAITHACKKAGFDFFQDANHFNAFILAIATFIFIKFWTLGRSLSNVKVSLMVVDVWSIVYLLVPCVVTTLNYYWNALFP